MSSWLNRIAVRMYDILQGRVNAELSKPVHLRNYARIERLQRHLNKFELLEDE